MSLLPQQHRRHRSLSSCNCERDDDLVLFHELQKKERADSFCGPVQRAPSLKNSIEEDILSSSEWDQHDYDWLMIPPSTPIIPTLDHRESFGNEFALAPPSMRSSTSAAISRLGSSNLEPLSKVEPSVRAVGRSFDSQDPSAPFRTPTNLTSRKSFSSSSSPHPSSTPGRSTTPISRPIARSSTPTRSASGAGIRPSTPTGRSTTPSNRAPSAAARPPTPIKRPATPTRANNSSSSTGKVSSSVSKQSAAASKSASSSRPSSPATARGRQPTAQPAHPAVIAGTLAEQPSNLRVDRPLSNPRGSMTSKMGSATSVVKPTPSEPADGGTRTKRPSSSPLLTRGRLSSESLNGGHKSSTQRTVKPNDASKVSVTSGAGSKMVDKHMPPRKPVIVSKERVPSAVNPQPVKALKSAPLRDVKSPALARESTGFGRNLSRKSLDMAIRHMEIRGSNTSSFQSFVSNVPTSSLYSVRSRNGRGNSSSSIASSPMATSSNASSEHGMSLVIDPESSDYFDETSSDVGSRASTISHADSTMAFSNERKVSHWLGSPGYMDDTSADIMQIFEQGLASLSRPESPLVSPQEGIIDCDKFTLEPM